MFNEIRLYIERVYGIPVWFDIFKPTSLNTSQTNVKDAFIIFNEYYWVSLGYDIKLSHIALLHELGHYLDFNRNENSFLEMRNVRHWRKEFEETKQFPEGIKKLELNAWRIAVNELFVQFNIELTQEIKDTIYKALGSYQIDKERVDQELFRVG